MWGTISFSTASTRLHACSHSAIISIDASPTAITRTRPTTYRERPSEQRRRCCSNDKTTTTTTTNKQAKEKTRRTGELTPGNSHERGAMASKQAYNFKMEYNNAHGSVGVSSGAC